MNVKKLNKIFVISILILIFSSFIYKVKAATLKDMYTDAKTFLDKGQQQATGIDTGEITGEFKDLGKILTTIGAGVMVGVTAYMGIKYLTAGPEAQGKLKTQLIGVVVSGVVIFGAYYVWKIVLTIVSNFSP